MFRFDFSFIKQKCQTEYFNITFGIKKGIDK
jgi:hypothetical protein